MCWLPRVLADAEAEQEAQAMWTTDSRTQVSELGLQGLLTVAV